METNDLHYAIIDELGDFVQSKSSTFACGGSILVHSATEASSPQASAPAITLRWDSPDSSSSIAKLSFPVNSSAIGQEDSLLKLAHDCQPASFGYKGEDVIDESYRKATKMDRSAFSVDFCPYELGIIDTITQLLLPNAGGSAGTKGVKAELYKLNIYAAPSGFFKAHVDTPRSNTQFGSLVVSLPCHHEGGQLIVRHAGQSVTFDWGASGSGEEADPAIKWAAFYSDCEHEVKKVTQGHRVTLTYNLYYTLGVGELSGKSPVMDAASLPLYRKIKEALEEPAFMADGGYLGVFCQHAYSHSTPEGIKALPGVLKGSDMAVHTVFQALGLNVFIQSVLDFKDSYLFERIRDDDEERLDEDFLAGLKDLVVSDVGGDDDDSPWRVVEGFGGDWAEVNWLTGPIHGNIGYVHLAYGNQASTDYMYTHAALIVSIPPASLRGKGSALDKAPLVPGQLRRCTDNL